MKAVIFSQPGGPEFLKITEVAAPSLSSHSVRIRVKAAGVNRADLSQRRGNYPPPRGESEILGLEVAGEVVEATSTSFKVGDRVAALLAGGGYAEEVVVSEKLTLSLPSSVSYVEGAAFVETFLTAYLNVFLLGKVQPQESVLIHAGASGVGLSAIQLLRAFGVSKIFTTVGSIEKKTKLSSYAVETILYKEEVLSEKIKGVDFILDPVGGSFFQEHFKILNPDGRWILIGLMGGTKADINLGQLLTKRIQLRGSTLRHLPLERKAEIFESFKKEIAPLFFKKQISPVIDTVFPFTQVQKAHERMERNENFGKIVLVWD